MTRAFEQGFSDYMQKIGQQLQDTVDPETRRIKVLSDTDVDSIHNAVEKYNDEIVLPIKQQFAGTPGVDYDARNYRNGFAMPIRLFRSGDENDINVGGFGPFKGLGASAAGYVKNQKSDNPELLINAGNGKVKSFTTAAHENAHAQNLDHKTWSFAEKFRAKRNKTPLSGRSAVEEQKLDAAYPFNNADVYRDASSDEDRSNTGTIKAEQGATNREIRAGIWNDLGQPDLKTLSEYIRNMTPEQLADAYDKYGNGYTQHYKNRRIINDPGLDWRKPSDLDKKLAPEIYNRDAERRAKAIERNSEWLENIRRALLEVAKNRNTGYPNTYTA